MLNVTMPALSFRTCWNVSGLTEPLAAVDQPHSICSPQATSGPEATSGAQHTKSQYDKICKQHIQYSVYFHVCLT